MDIKNLQEEVEELKKQLEEARKDKARLDALDNEFYMHYNARMYRQGPYMDNRNIAFSTQRDRSVPRKKNFATVRQVADFLIELDESEKRQSKEG